MKPLAIAFSDLHINDWAKFNKDNERTLNHFKVLHLIKGLCSKYGCPAIFCGDLFHKPENISNSMLALTLNQCSILFEDRDFQMIAISGNHDFAGVSTPEIYPDSWVRTLGNNFSSFYCIDWGRIIVGRVKFWGVPYVDHNMGVDQYLHKIINSFEGDYKNILLLHSDYPGAKDTDGTEVGSCENLNTNLLQKFDLVLMGHIHKPQKLGKKIIMVGAPLQQRRTDKNCDMGYWKIYPDLKAVFVPFDEFPQFVDVESEEEIQDDGNYYTIMPKPRETHIQEAQKINRDMSKRKLVKSYLSAKGITDPLKKKTLVRIIKEAEE